MARKDTDKVKTADAGTDKIFTWLKQHPAIVVTMATAAGVSGEHVQTLMESDIPGWLLGVVVLLFAVGSWAKKVANGMGDLVGEFREFRSDTIENQKTTTLILDELMLNRDGVLERLKELESRNSDPSLPPTSADN